MKLSKPKALLSPPMGECSAVTIDRPDPQNMRYTNLSDQFRVRWSMGNLERQKKEKTRFFKSQFHNARLEIMRPLIVEEARRMFGPALVIKTLGQLTLEEEEEEEEGNVLVLGVLRKHYVLEPSKLADLETEKNVDFEPGHSRYLSQQDSLALEDQNISLELAGYCLDPGQLVSLSLVHTQPDTVL